MQLLNIQQAAKKLSLSKSKLYGMVAKMEISHVRFDSVIRFVEDDLDAYISEKRVEPNGRKPRMAPRRPKLNHIKLS